MRSILRGNSATQFRSELVQCIHTIANGMCKGASSLRTTLSSNSCQLIKRMCRDFEKIIRASG